MEKVFYVTYSSLIDRIRFYLNLVKHGVNFLFIYLLNSCMHKRLHSTKQVQGPCACTFLHLYARTYVLTQLNVMNIFKVYWTHTFLLVSTVLWLFTNLIFEKENIVLCYNDNIIYNKNVYKKISYYITLHYITLLFFHHLTLLNIILLKTECAVT